MSVDKRSGTSTWKPAPGSPVASQKKRRAAYTELEAAQRRGELPKAHRGKCAICGKQAMLEADHPGDNYKNPTGVRWICRSCNARRIRGKR